ncbi:MAG: hypothetical protein M1823_002480 [Watsoniomyces obsoletus]|nr:MAG: hypothetical protein M1823_002480 [Watsoniomyces obsoletus]
MKILVAPSGFKESLQAHDVADAIEAGLRRVMPSVQVQKLPLVDGGEGFARTLVSVTEGKIQPVTVTGPVGTPITSHYGFLGGRQSKTAVIEMAAAAGLALVPRLFRDPTVTTSYGVGELIRHALDQGAQRILVGCGDSGTNDGGAGMLQALGARLIGTDGEELPRPAAGRDLLHLTDLDLTGLHARLQKVRIDVACNWNNVLGGPKGVARYYGPQKGATGEQVETLSDALEQYASIIETKLGWDVSLAPGSGASGGLGTGLLILGARLRPRYDIISDFLHIDRSLQNCDLVVTAEGGIDFQTPQGKMPAELAIRAKQYGLPVITLAGTVGPGAEASYESGIDAYVSILQRPTSLEAAMRDTVRLLKDGAEAAMRMVMIGQLLLQNSQAP